MKPLWTLIKLYVNSIFRFQVMRYSKDGRERRNAIMSLAAIVLIVVVYGGMSGVLTAQMLSAGVDASIPFLLVGTMGSLFALAIVPISKNGASETPCIRKIASAFDADIKP